METYVILAAFAGLPVIALAAIVWLIRRREMRPFLNDSDDWGAQ